MIKRLNKKGQSTIEYLVLVTAVIAVLIVFLNPKSGPFAKRFNAALQEATKGMDTMANRLTASHPGSTTNAVNAD